jgi:hypothetical protein
MNIGEFQSKTIMLRLWKGVIDPLRTKSGGGAHLLGFFFEDELGDGKPQLTNRGDTIFVLQAGLSRNVGHWCCITRKTKEIRYFDPAFKLGGERVPPDIHMYLNKQHTMYTVVRSSPQKSLSDNGCGLYCISFLKKEYNG